MDVTTLQSDWTGLLFFVSTVLFSRFIIPQFLVLFQSCCSYVRVFGKTRAWVPHFLLPYWMKLPLFGYQYSFVVTCLLLKTKLNKQSIPNVGVFAIIGVLIYRFRVLSIIWILKTFFSKAHRFHSQSIILYNFHACFNRSTPLVNLYRDGKLNIIT